MASKQAVASEALAAQIYGMSRSEMYDMMSKMKTMIDHDQETVRRMLVNNPDVTRALFRAQVVLGMVKTPKTVCKLSSRTSLNINIWTANQQLNFTVFV